TFARMLLPRRRRKYHLVAPDAGAHVDWATGCCLLVRRRLLDELGGLDPDFFLYYEDVDLCRRARRAGWDVRHEPAPEVVHHTRLRARRGPPLLRLLTRHALLTYAAKHWPRWQGWLLGWAVQAEAWLRRRRAKGRGDNPSAEVFAHLGALAAEMRAGDH